MCIRDDATFATRATDAASRVSSATANTNGADTFRSTTSADNRRNYRDECLANAKRKAAEIAAASRSSSTVTENAQSDNSTLQGKPASNGSATTSPSKTSDANSREAAMGSGAEG